MLLFDCCTLYASDGPREKHEATKKILGTWAAIQFLAISTTSIARNPSRFFDPGNVERVALI